MIRRTLPAAVAVLALSLGGCDSTGTVILVPELQERFDFQASLEGWTARSGDLPVGAVVGVERATGPGAGGEDGWVRITAVADEPRGRVWIERPFEVTPDQSYEVTVAYQLGTADGSSTTPWEVVSGVDTEAPTSVELLVRGSTAPESPGDGLVWEPREHTFVVFSGPADSGEESATVWVALGLGLATVDVRQYGLDEIEVSFLRN